MSIEKDVLSVKLLWSMTSAGTLMAFPPQAPTEYPDGRFADEREMVAAMLRFRRYNSDVEAYLKYLALELNAHRISSSTHLRIHNEAVDKLHSIVGEFNVQVRIYKARHHGRLAYGSARLH